MKITWEDRKSSGHIDGHVLSAKPVFSFEYAWFLVTDTTAQFVESHDEEFENTDMTPAQKQEVMDFYVAWVPPVPSLATISASKVTAIKAERDRRKFNGVFVSDKWIHTDTYSRTQWMGMVMMGASVPAIEWTTMDNTSITTSQALAGAVFQATATLDSTLFAFAKSLIDTVNASSDPASVDITTGWPATFEGA